MAPTKKQIVKHLRAAKVLLANGDGFNSLGKECSSYICDCVESVAIDEHDNPVRAARTANYITALIRKRICKRFSIKDWLIECADIPEELITDDALQAYRHSWVDSLIEEFSK